MQKVYRRRRMPYSVLARWLAICLPVGLYHLWHERYRMHWSVKVIISFAATACTIFMLIGAISLFSQPAPVMAQSTSAALAQHDIYPLVVDEDGKHYHLKGCVYAKPNAMSVTLLQAARQHILPDEMCNPPRYNNRN